MNPELDPLLLAYDAWLQAGPAGLLCALAPRPATSADDAAEGLNRQPHKAAGHWCPGDMWINKFFLLNADFVIHLP